MKKIPTIFQRSEDRRSIIDEVTPGCEWVLAGEGVPTFKWDGTAVLIQRDYLDVRVFTRREFKGTAVAPDGWFQVDYDPETRKYVGWEPAWNSGWYKYIEEALESDAGWPQAGTYELVGPKVQTNRHQLASHALIRHGTGHVANMPTELTFFTLRDWFTSPMRGDSFEGVVWHHPDGRMGKLKARDFK